MSEPTVQAVSEAMLQAMLDALIEPAALMDIGGQILAVNQQWTDNARPYGSPDVALGGNYLDFWRREARENGSMSKWLASMFDMFNGDLERLEIVVDDAGVLGGVEFNLELTKVALGNQTFVLVRGHDITRLTVLKDQKHQLAYGVIREREQERRRIARDLHDSTAQLLVGLQLNIAHLRETAKKLGEGVVEPPAQPILRQCATTLEALQKELLDFGFLLEPPGLSEQGVADTMDAMAESFAAATGVAVNASYSVAVEPSEAIGLTLYRLAQEAFANAQRHAHATKIDLVLTTDQEVAHLVISDEGSGEETTGSTAGVGIASMKERVAECGGQISVALQSTGSVVDVVIPLGGPINPLPQRG